jgi:hypothetical protein
MLLPACIIDDFLGADAAARLLDFALESRESFAPSFIYSGGVDRVVKPSFRASLTCQRNLDEVIAPFHAAVSRALGRIRAETGTTETGTLLRNLDLLAYRDGHRFGLHIDTAIGANRALNDGDRVVSLVYFLHRQPRGFTGGNLVLHALGEDKRHVIEPRHDRLVAFSSITPHEVEPITVPGDDFADARFSIACWLLRERASAAA